MGNELSERLAYALEYREKKPIDLAKALGISRAGISQYLSGHTKTMSAERVFQICKYLNISEAWLLGFEGAPMERSEMERMANDIKRVRERMEKDAAFRTFAAKACELSVDKVNALLSLI